MADASHWLQRAVSMAGHIKHNIMNCILNELNGVQANLAANQVI